MSIGAIGVVLILAVIVEAIIQVLKSWIPEQVVTPAWLWPVVGAALGIALCVLSSADVLTIAGVPLGVPWIGAVLTGILISRGASFVHDLWGKVTEYKGIAKEVTYGVDIDDLASKAAEIIKREQELPRREPPEDPGDTEG